MKDVEALNCTAVQASVGRVQLKNGRVASVTIIVDTKNLGVKSYLL